jgi:DNA-binding CsgD family transcriptional regulator
VVISGESGIGKTALYRAVVDLVAGDGARVISTTGLREEAAPPLSNLADLLDPAVRDVLPQLPPVQADALRVALRLTDAGTSPDDALLVRATVNGIRALASPRLLLAIDDEQWLDADTRRLLKVAASWLTGQPVTWLISVRDGQADGGLAGLLARALDPHLVRLELAPLSDEFLTQLITDRFPGRWSPRLLRQIVELSGGNPYAVEELARETMTIHGCDASEAQVPSSLANSLEARLRRLEPSVAAVVQAAALTPLPTRRLLRGVIGLDVGAGVDEAVEAQVLEETSPDPVLRFTHPLLREVIQASVSGSVRRHLHRRLASATDDPDEAAAHLAAAAEEPEESLAEMISTAAKRALARGAPLRALALSETALALTPDADGLPAWRRRLLELDCLIAANEFDRARTKSAGWSASAPKELRGESAARRAWVEPDQAVAIGLLAQAAEALNHDAAQASQVGAELARRVGIMLLRPTEAQPIARKAVEDARCTNDSVGLRRALAVQGFLMALTGRPEAGVQLRAAVAVPGLRDMPHPYDAPETRLAMWHMWRGEVNRARELHQAVLDAGEQRGAEESTSGTRLHLVEVEWRAGRWEQAARHARAVERYERETGYGQAGMTAYALSLIATARGEVGLARQLAVEGLRGAARQTDRVFAAQCRCVLGQLELSVDDPTAAVAWLDPVASLLTEHGLGEPGLLPFTPDLIEGYARTGRHAEAEQQLQWLQDAAARLDHPWARIAGGRAAAVFRLARRQPAEAIEAVADSVTEAVERGLPFELGRCLLVLGTAQRRSRRRQAAADTLDEAVAVFDHLGAPRWSELGRRERARLVHSSKDTLTPTEQRVADLASQGLTNTEIASALLVSVKTVESNLTRVYRKLGVRGRVELTRRHTP